MAEVALDLSLYERQLTVLDSEATEILFGGASAGGKSHVGRVLLVLLCLEIPGLQCALIRKKYDTILENHVEGPTGFRALLGPLVQLGKVRITESNIKFPNGSIIHFVHCQDERQFDTAQGVERHVLFIDEATQISERLINTFRAWVRMTPEMKAKLPPKWRNKLPFILYTANPIGVSAPYFRRAFVKARAAMAIDDVDGFKRQYIPSRIEDNPSADALAQAGRLAGLGDEALAKALREGDWDAPVGDYFTQYDDSRHTVPDHLPAKHLFKFRTFDWGSAEPFAVHWWYVSDGEEYKLASGDKFWTPKGSLVCYREWFGCRPEKPAQGLQMRNEDVARGILARSPEAEGKLLTLTDSLPFQDRGMSKNGKEYRIADVFDEEGVPLTKAITARVHGWSQLRDRLIGQDGMPLIYFCAYCTYIRDYIPAIGRSKTDPEDAEDSGEASHCCDSARYAASSRPRTLMKPPDAPETAGIKNEMTFDEVVAKITLKKKQRAGAGW